MLWFILHTLEQSFIQYNLSKKHDRTVHRIHIQSDNVHTKPDKNLSNNLDCNRNKRIAMATFGDQGN